MIALGLMMFVPMITVVPDTAKAVSTTWFSYWPSAYNSTFWQVYPKYITGVVTCYPAQIDDSVTKDLHSTATYAYVETNDFTNPTWYGPEPLPEYASGDPCPNNGTATIVAVLIYANFMTWHPEITLYFSVNDKASWSAGYSVSAGYGEVGWNVTALIAWTPEIMNSDDTWIRLRAQDMSSSNYYLDYLGFLYSYTVPWGGGYIPPDPPDPEDEDGPSWTYNLTGGGVVGVMGVVGLCGMVGVPAWAVLAWRNGQDTRVGVFVKALVMGMFCFAMFWVSLVGG